MKIAIMPFCGEFRVTITPDSEDDRVEIARAYEEAVRLGVDIAPIEKPEWLTIFARHSILPSLVRK